MRKTICRVEVENTFLASTTSIFGLLANKDTMEAMATWAIMAENNFLEALFWWLEPLIVRENYQW